MALSAHGGHICWRCQVGKQVEAHLASSAHHQAQRRAATGIANVVLGMFAGGAILFAAMFAIGMLLVLVAAITS